VRGGGYGASPRDIGEGKRHLDRREIGLATSRQTREREVVRRWQVNESQRAIARATGLARETVKKYLAAAGDLGLSATGPPPTERDLVELRRLGVVATQLIMRVAPQAATLAAYRDQLATWIDDDHLLLTRVQELLGQQGAPVAYTTLRRYVRQAGLWKQPRSTGAHGANGAWRSGRDGFRQAGHAHQPGHRQAPGGLGATGGFGV
jgi:transposase